jgi:hypothetical protein
MQKGYVDGCLSVVYYSTMFCNVTYVYIFYFSLDYVFGRHIFGFGG